MAISTNSPARVVRRPNLSARRGINTQPTIVNAATVIEEIPASRKKRAVILRWLAERFQVGARYPESAVNALIGRHHPDFATLRRELIGARLLNRANGVYWRPDEPPGADALDPPTEPGNVSSDGEPAGRLAEVAVR